MHSLQKLQLYRNLECELFVQRTVYSARCFKHFIFLRELYDTSDDLPKRGKAIQEISSQQENVKRKLLNMT